MATKRWTKQERDEAIEFLRRVLSPSSTVYCILRHVAASGMSRSISFYTITNNEPVMLTGRVGRVLGYRMDGREGLHVQGCGMDMGFAVVHELSLALHGRKASDVPGEAPGYTLKHRWL